VLSSNLLIRLFSVKRVARSCRISQTCTRFFCFQRVLLQPLEADLVRTNYKLSEAKLVWYLLLSGLLECSWFK